MPRQLVRTPAPAWPWSVSVRTGPLWWRLPVRPDERRCKSWAGLTPVERITALELAGADRQVIGVGVHIGPYMALVCWE